MPRPFQAVKSDWCLGSEAFRQEFLAQVSTKRGLWHFGPEFHESAQAKAQRIISSELNAMGMTEQDFERQPKGAPVKVDLALKLRAKTTVTLGWIAQPLHMGKRGHLKHLLYWHNKVKKTAYKLPTYEAQPLLLRFYWRANTPD